MIISEPAQNPLASPRSYGGLALAGLLLAAGVLAPAAAPAQLHQPATNLAGQIDPHFRPGHVRLNFITRRWPDVLRQIAEESGSTLIMDEAPNSLYSRRDLKKYSRPDAVRILNRELELQGYRLSEQGQFLVLENLRQTRTEYEQPVLPPPADMSASPPADAPPRAQNWQREVVTIASRDEPATADGTSRDTAPVRSADHHEEIVAPAEARPASGPPVLLRVPTQRNAAADVARMIFTVYKTNAHLIEEGPDGLPAFTVARPGSGSVPPQPDYAVGINTDTQELVVSAPESRARQIEQLIRRLDATPVREGQTIELVRAEGDVRGKAAKVQALADGLLAQVRIQQVPQDGQPQQRDQPQQERPEQPGEERPEAAPPGGVPLRLDLQGPVQIQDVPGIGLIITGNRADVEAVTQIIRALELAGAGVTPDIHLLKLRHVNSASLAALLTQVYERVSTMRAPGLTAANIQAPTIQILPVAMPNAILIIAPARDMESVLTLAEELDQPLDPEAEFEVFRLQHAAASQLVTTIESFFEADEETGVRIPLAPRARAVADVRTNSLVVQARGRDMEEVARLIRRLDKGTSAAVSRMRIFPLQNAMATQLSLVINEAIQSVLRPPTPTLAGQVPGAAAVGAAGEIPTELRVVRSAILEFLATEGDVERLIRSGILADIRITADPARNALIVTAPEQSMDLLAALIAHLDLPTPLVAEVKVITLQNSDATAAADLLRTLFAPAGAVPGQQGFPGAGGQNQIAVQIAGAEGAGAGLIPLRFSVDTRTNSIVVMGPAEAIDIVQAILLRLDESDIRQRQMRVIKLSNTFAPDVAAAINQFLTAQRGLAQVDPNLVTSIELLEREVIVVPEPISNSLIISATPRYFDEIVAMIERLDRKPPEVMIQAMIVEVELDNVDEFGVELGFQDEVLFSRSVNGVPGFNFNNLPFGNNPVNPADVGAQGLSDFGLSRTNDEFGFGGLVLAAGSESVSVLIRALSAKRNVHVLSRPQIRTLDNQLAQIVVGQSVPIVNGIIPTGGLGGASPNVVPRDVGIILAVTPRVSPDGTIVIETIATRSALAGQGVPIFVDSDSGNVIEAPIINQTQAQAVISVPNGQTVVLGGMITKTDNAFERKVPWLGDLPYLGYAFRYDSVRTRRTELLIFLTPRIIRHEADSELIKRVEAERLHFIEQDLEDAHGPLYSAPPPDWMGELGMPGAGYCPPPLFDDSDIPTTILGPMDYSATPLSGGRIESHEIVPGQTAPIPTTPPPAPPETFFPATP